MVPNRHSGSPAAPTPLLAVAVAVALSAALPAASSAAAGTACQTVANVDYENGFVGKTWPVTTAQECCDLCAADPAECWAATLYAGVCYAKPAGGAYLIPGGGGIAVVFPPGHTPPPLAGSYEYVDLKSSAPDAVCLDGSAYGFAFCSAANGSTAAWNIAVEGGGWCYDTPDCTGRANTSLGSSASWPAAAAQMFCDPAATTNDALLFYGDGASFSGFRAEPVPAPAAPGGQLFFRGIRNFDASVDALLARGLRGATSVALTGGSAGGLSALLHLDRLRDRLAVEAPAARVVGRPVCGYFLEHGNDGFAPANQTYALQMRNVFEMQNASGSLSPECQAAHAPDSWRCIFAPSAALFVRTPFFLLQSRFDEWQLGYILFLPCMQAQSWGPPYSPSTCSPQEDAAIAAYGYDFMAQLQPVVDAPGSLNGGFVDACIIHGSTSSTIDGLTNDEAFSAWLSWIDAGAGRSLSAQRWWAMACGIGPNATSAGPCDKGPTCAPFP